MSQEYNNTHKVYPKQNYIQNKNLNNQYTPCKNIFTILPILKSFMNWSSVKQKLTRQ